MFLLISILALFTGAALASPYGELQNNLAIQSYDKAKEAEKVRTGFLGRSFLPSVGLELGQERFKTGPYQVYTNPYAYLEGRFNLFRGGRDSLESQYRDLQANIGKFNQDQASRDELNKVRKLQWQIIHNIELIKILEQERSQNAKIREQANRRAQSGVSTKTDVLEFAIYDSELEESIESLKHENLILKTGLRPLLGMTGSEELTFAQSLEHQHDEELIVKKHSSKNNPSVARIEAESEGFEVQKKVWNRWWTPSVDLYGGYYLYTLRDRDYLSIQDREDTVVGVRLTLEIFDGMKSYNQSTSTHYQAESKKLMARHMERQTDAQFIMSQEDMKHTHEVMHYIEDRIKKSKDYLSFTLKEYDRGVKNSLDALVAMQRYYRYEKQYLEKKKEYQIIKADLLAILGE
jgi:outer membrane protein TolC